MEVVLVDQAGELRAMKNGRADLKTMPSKCNGNIRVIAVTSGKGGVGKTHITAILAYLLSKRGKNGDDNVHSGKSLKQLVKE